ncbi:hypothetical protein FD754_015518, partial [Muntiacus muntjak]
VEERGDLPQAHIQQLSEASGKDDHFLILASAHLEKWKRLCYLDMTYFVENKQVDEDFLEGTAQKELINFLSEPETLLKENNVHLKHCDFLGDELLECIPWRCGALLYMYCHSLTKRRKWLRRKFNLLKKYLCPIQLNKGVSFQDLEMCYWGLKNCVYR